VRCAIVASIEEGGREKQAILKKPRVAHRVVCVGAAFLPSAVTPELFALGNLSCGEDPI